MASPLATVYPDFFGARFKVLLLWHLMKSVAVYPNERSGTRGRTLQLYTLLNKITDVTNLSLAQYISSLDPEGFQKPSGSKDENKKTTP